MPINKSELKRSNTKPDDFAHWVDCVKAAAQLEGLANLSSVTDHHIMPQNEILGLLGTAIDGSSDEHLIQAARYAVDWRVIANQGTDQDKLEELMSRILWTFGNVFPGPENVTRIDDPMTGGGWELPGALTKAYAYARKLKAILEAFPSTRSAGAQWRALVDYVNPQGQDNQDAQNDILEWADAWATHPTYRIYVRLTRGETEFSRGNYDSFPGFGAWIDPRHPALEKLGSRLARWEQTIKASSEGPDRDIATKAMCTDIGGNCSKRWLDRHLPDAR